jgi:outer membrane protein assembly factor BamE (lipoprotein component of BamABCDE complex)
MQRKSRLALALFLIFAAALTIGIPMSAQRQQGITFANYGRLQKGMTRDDAMQILGRPNLQDDVDGCAWRNDNGDTVAMEFDAAGRAVWYAWNDVPDERTFWQKLRDRIPWFAKPPPRIELLSL